MKYIPKTHLQEAWEPWEQHKGHMKTYMNKI